MSYYWFNREDLLKKQKKSITKKVLKKRLPVIIRKINKKRRHKKR